MTRSRAFTIWPALWLVLVIFLGVAVTQLVLNQHRPGFSWPLMIMAFVVFPVMISAVLALVGWVISRRRDAIFNGVFVTVLGLLTGTRVVIMSISMLGQPASNQQAAKPAPAAPIASKPQTSPSPRPIDRPLPQPRPPTARPEAPRAQTPPRPEPRPDPLPDPTPAVDVTQITDKLKAEYESQSAALHAAADTAYSVLSKPKRDKKAMQESLDRMRTLADQAEAFEKKSRGLDDEAREAFTKAGLSMGDAMTRSSEFARSLATFARASAAADLARDMTAGADLFSLAIDHYSSIRVQQSGKITSTNKDVESKLFHARFRVETAVSNKERTLSALRPKP